MNTPSSLAVAEPWIAHAFADAVLRQMVVASVAPSWLMSPLLKLTRRNKVLRDLASLSDGTTDEYFRTAAELQQLRAAALAAMSGADIVLSPAVALPAIRHGATAELSMLGTYTTYWNALGWPAGVVPITHVRAGEESDRPPSRDRFEQAARESERGSVGLPIAVQVAAAPHRDHVALAALRALERAR